MANNKLGFEVSYTVNIITSIKPTPSGKVDGNNYPASVKLRSSMILIEEGDFGQVEKETNIEFSIPCEDERLRDLNTWLRVQQKDNNPLIINGTLPYSSGSKAIFTVKSLLTGEEMMSTKIKKA